MTTIRSARLLAAAALVGAGLAAAATPAAAEIHTRDTGESIEVVRTGRDALANVVGGGEARVVGSGDNRSVEYVGPQRSQPAAYAHVVGSGENVTVVHSPHADRATALAALGIEPAPAAAAPTGAVGRLLAGLFGTRG